jgi:crotonobetainyl-CoA:carnitine CoA-transferase CaiB-like acyl-CoA transferase
MFVEEKCTMSLPLEKIRVLDFTMLLPGPWCTLMLADFGAEVIKIEEPTKGDYIRWYPPSIRGISARHLLINRNKKSMTLNLKEQQGRQVLSRLLETADVLVDGFRPGVMARLGFGYKRVSEINPRVIYCSISGYGQDGPYSNLVGHDINYLGIAGILDITGQQDGPPVIPGVQISDIASGGMMAVIAILIALIARNKTGKGQYLDISMLDGNIAQLYAIAGDYFAAGVSPKRGEIKGESRVLGGYACYSIYKTRDNKYITVAPLEEKFWATLCEKLGRSDLVGLQFDPKMQPKIRSDLQDIFVKKTRDEWVREFDGLDVCLGPVNTVEEALSDPQVVSRGMVVEVEHPEIGMVPQIGIPIKLSESKGEIRKPAPGFGQDTEEILKELGFGKELISTTKKGGK